MTKAKINQKKMFKSNLVEIKKHFPVYLALFFITIFLTSLFLVLNNQFSINASIEINNIFGEISRSIETESVANLNRSIRNIAIDFLIWFSNFVVIISIYLTFVSTLIKTKIKKVSSKYFLASLFCSTLVAIILYFAGFVKEIDMGFLAFGLVYTSMILIKSFSIKRFFESMKTIFPKTLVLSLIYFVFILIHFTLSIISTINYRGTNVLNVIDFFLGLFIFIINVVFDAYLSKKSYVFSLIASIIFILVIVTLSFLFIIKLHDLAYIFFITTLGFGVPYIIKNCFELWRE